VVLLKDIVEMFGVSRCQLAVRDILQLAVSLVGAKLVAKPQPEMDFRTANREDVEIHIRKRGEGHP
jgi:hypothetical protein